MRKFAFALLFAILSSTAIMAQKVGIVDTKYILEKMPQYAEAEQRMNQQISTWQTEMAALQAEYDKKKAAFESERVLLVGDQLKTRQNELTELEKNIKSTLSLRFGNNGEIAKLRASLVQPFQDQIWDAIKTMAEKNGLGMVLDKADTNVLFLQKRYDYTDKVLDILVKGIPVQPGKKSKN